MKILNKFVEFIKSLIFNVRKQVHVEVPETSEKKVETGEQIEKHEQVEKPVEVPETPVKAVKRRGRPRKVKAE